MSQAFSKFLSRGVVILLLFLLDLYVFQAVRTATQDLAPLTQQLLFYTYWAIFVLMAGTFILVLAMRGTPPTAFQTYYVSLLFGYFAAQLVALVFLVLDDLVRLGKELFSSTADVPRSELLSQLGLLLGVVIFLAFIWGMAKGAYTYRVKHITLRFPNLPQAFNGFKMLQISDLHTGSFQSLAPLQEAVQLINKQQADVVFFTGDLVNNMAVEVQKHIQTLKEIKARIAVFSVLGNHDYGDYVRWPNPEVKRQNLRTLIESHGKMGWDILLNENRVVEKDGEHIAVLGVENWGNRAGFPKYGQLDKAYAGVEDVPFKVLLSHDPSHWDGEITKQYPDIDLTLSGHTHGMQFGLNVFGWKWSPVQYVYKQWAGLYKRGRQLLYVNTGLGFLGYPGRVGFLPEITVFELQRA
ncbi:metallophosphoesterase [Pontibacter chitinilyticus]|uniref:metallophosphoesterase n=1 Tax=Pontibacter chitinilyticus TaxID=2674989 RepID=UPI00321A4D5A